MGQPRRLPEGHLRASGEVLVITGDANAIGAALVRGYAEAGGTAVVDFGFTEDHETAIT
jgi:NAD(P)-dependent dehydrogenase (short-subunit alcohol dehydrogenase family)